MARRQQLLGATNRRAHLASRKQLAKLRSELALQRCLNALESLDLVGRQRIAAPTPQDGPKLRNRREADAVVDPVDLPPAVDRQDVAAFAVGVVHDRVED